MMTDYFGTEINLGDHILVARHGRTSVNLIDGIVTEKTDKSIKVQCKTKQNNKLYDIRVYSPQNCVIVGKCNI